MGLLKGLDKTVVHAPCSGFVQIFVGGGVGGETIVHVIVDLFFDEVGLDIGGRSGSIGRLGFVDLQDGASHEGAASRASL